MAETACHTAHVINCSEVWGGNRGNALSAETNAVRASLFSRACDGCRGGDIYYFSVCSTGELTRVGIADVMGHGTAVSDTSQWLYESLVRHMNSPDNAAVLTDLNKASVDKGYQAMSTAAVAAFYRSDRRLCFSYAGHHELLLKRKGSAEWVPIRGHEPLAFGDIPLGIDARARFAENSITLSRGDRVLLYTDGIVEAPNVDDEPFGLQRLVDTLKAISSDRIEHVRTGVLDALLEHTSDSLVHDDVTFIVLEVTGGTEHHPVSKGSFSELQDAQGTAITTILTQQNLQEALSAAASAHHEYEQNVLRGARDEQWPGWYAAYVLGRLGDFTLPSNLTEWLRGAPSDERWAAAAATYVANQLDRL